MAPPVEGVHAFGFEFPECASVCVTSLPFRRREGAHVQVQKLTSVGVVSLGKVTGMTGVLLGFLVAIPYGLMAMLFGASVGKGAGVLGLGAGLAVMFVVPFLYGAATFVIGCLYGLVLNVVLRMSGGLAITIR